MKFRRRLDFEWGKKCANNEGMSSIILGKGKSINIRGGHMKKSVHWKIWSKDRKDHDLDHIWWSWSRSRSNFEKPERIWSFEHRSEITQRSFFEPFCCIEEGGFGYFKGKNIKSNTKRQFFERYQQKMFLKYQIFYHCLHQEVKYFCKNRCFLRYCDIFLKH